MSEKTRLIKSICPDGRGVIPLHAFQAALSEQAFVREECMIEQKVIIHNSVLLFTVIDSNGFSTPVDRTVCWEQR